MVGGALAAFVAVAGVAAVAVLLAVLEAWPGRAVVLVPCDVAAAVGNLEVGIDSGVVGPGHDAVAVVSRAAVASFVAPFEPAASSSSSSQCSQLAVEGGV